MQSKGRLGGRLPLTGRSPVRLAATILALLTINASGESLYKAEQGTFDVKVADNIVVTDPVQQREVSFRVLYPDGDGPFPVVAFSSGGFCAARTYDGITAHWVSHGYVVIEPTHMDSPDNAKPFDRSNMDMLMPTRLRDVSFALDALDDIGQQANIASRIAPEGRAVAGHSFGAGIASMKAGVKVKPEFQGPWGEPYDERFQALIVLSAPGDGPELGENPYSNLRLPLMATGGTADVGRGYDPSMSPAEFRRITYQQSPAGDKYSVILTDANHFLGGLLCKREDSGEPDPGAITIVGAMTTAFLDAYIKEDPAAREFLLTADMAAITNGRLDYRHR